MENSGNPQQAYERKMAEEAQKQYLSLTQRNGGTAPGHPHPAAHPRSQGKTYPSPHPVMKIKTVKPEKATGIENSVIKAAQSGALKNRLTEQELVSLLERESESRAEQKVTVRVVLGSSSATASTTNGDPLL
jgi:hypothetical protein